MEKDVRDKLIKAILKSVVFDGWSNGLINSACKELDLNYSIAKTLFPRGIIEIAIDYHKNGDEKMIDSLKNKDFKNYKIREKIFLAIQTRLQIEKRDKELIRRSVSFFSLPQNFLDGNQLVWGTAHKIWSFLGDQSTDYNYYSKRAILSAVYGSVVLYWLGDDSKNSSSTWEFLERRIQNVMLFESFKAKLKSDPFISKKLTIPKKILEKINKPSDIRELKVPGTIDDI